MPTAPNQPPCSGVAQRRTQPVEGGCGDRLAALDPQQRAEAEDVHRAAGDPRVDTAVEVGRAVVTEPRRAAGGVDDMGAEGEEAAALRVEPGVVGARASGRSLTAVTVSP